MDHDATKDGTGSGGRRTWRERLGVGQDLPKISDEFIPVQSHADPSAGEAQAAAQSPARPGTPVARPAPMAPRYARPAAPRPGNGTALTPDAHGTHGSRSADAPRPPAGSPDPRQWATPSDPAHQTDERPRHRRPGEGHRSGASAYPSAAAGPHRAGHAPRADAMPGPQRPAPTRGPAAYVQAASRSGSAQSASPGDSFAERLRAQREAAERLARQRLAAARDRSAHAGADTLAGLAPRKSEAVVPGQTVHPRRADASPKPVGAEQPRFTFAREEIAAAQQETAFIPVVPPPEVPSNADAASSRQEVRIGPGVPISPDGSVTGTPQQRPEPHPEYPQEDGGMFEDEGRGFQATPARASAADYSAAYRDFEDEFEDEPRRGSGPLLLLLSLAGVAVVGGGLIYWYQQSEDVPAPQARELPVITAPETPAKADPAPPPQPQQAAQPVQRKQIYDRIIGEETLEPERIVPTEEEPQLQQIQQPEAQPPRASGEDQFGSPDAAQQNQSTEPLPLPLPPPPGTGEQGDLLVPGGAVVRAAASGEAAGERLTLPGPDSASVSTSDRVSPPSFRQAAVEPTPADPAAPPPVAAAGAVELRDTTIAPEREIVAAAIVYPEPIEPLVYPGTEVNRAAQDRSDPQPSSGPEEAGIAAVPEPEPEPTAAVEAEPELKQIANVPLPVAKPEPPVRTAANQPPEPQPERQANPQPSGSGPVQILPADIASGQAPAQARAAQPQVQPDVRRRTVGREYDPLQGQRSAYDGTSAVVPEKPAAPRQTASLAPEVAAGQAGSDGGYVVQLASFRSEAEAQSEYSRLSQRHPDLLGDLQSRVQRASLGQSGLFYRLGVGPIADRNEATRLCNALIEAGEKDCLVRRR